MAWATPKTDWATDDAVGTTDLNRIEENIKDLRLNGATNGRIGRAGLTVPLSGGFGSASVVVSNTSITASTKIQLTVIGAVGPATSVFATVSAVSVGASFTIFVGVALSGFSSIALNIDYLLMEPQ